MAKPNKKIVKPPKISMRSTKEQLVAAYEAEKRMVKKLQERVTEQQDMFSLEKNALIVSNNERDRKIRELSSANAKGYHKLTQTQKRARTQTALSMFLVGAFAALALYFYLS